MCIRDSNFSIGKCYDSGQSGTSSEYESAMEAVKKAGIPYQRVHQGEVLESGDMFMIEVLSPPEKHRFSDAQANNSSVVLRVTCGDIRFLFTGNIEEEAEKLLLQNYGKELKADILQVSRYGSNTSSTLAFLETVRPEVALISVGKGNPFNHPSPEVLSRLSQLGIKIFRTDQDGNIIVTTNGKRFKVETEKSR